MKAGAGIEALDLFSAAAGGWSLGLHRAGFRTLAACEAVDWRRALYAENNPGVPIYDDVRTLTAARLVRDLGRLPALVVGSPPCQDISSANTKGKGIEGERSGLFFEAVRLIGEIRPRWFALENSANLRTRGADAVLAALEGLRYACWAFVVRASDIGANHERARSWIIGCDLDQIADANGNGWAAQWSGRRSGVDLSDANDPFDPEGLGYVSGWSWGYGSDGNGSAYACDPNGPAESEERGVRRGQDAKRPRDASHTDEQPSAEGLSASEEQGCGDIGSGSVRPDAECGRDGSLHAADATSERQPAGARDCQGEHARSDGRSAEHSAGDGQPRTTPDPDQAGQADGCLDASLRQEEVAGYGCGDGRSADGQGLGQVDLCADDCGDPDGSWPLWSLDDLAGRLRLDDGLPARVAGTRVALGTPKGQSAASLIVEAYGDAVVPQIPEAIGRAILRVEAALAAIQTPLARAA